MADVSVVVKRSNGETLFGPETMADATIISDLIKKLPVEANPWKLSLGCVAAETTHKLSDLAEGGELELIASSAPAWDEAKRGPEGLHDPSLQNARHPPFGAS
eukprot:TRINITY_DN29640_c0_g1_i1.p1 TRINITY_DN29640_c0_g1~~TRINITY_DN29640_c0_g1_i1.p1  ORF type:complete len:103 (+),score=21.55 TRINITY_DN29640_c0_g1_i1:90-398(+)